MSAIPASFEAKGSFPCDRDGFVQAQAFLEARIDDPKPAVIMDEIVSNIVRCSGAGVFTLQFRNRDDGALEMTFGDDGVPFDPTTEIAQPDVRASAADRPIGGLGMFMVRKMAKSVVYRREGGLNVLTVVL